MRRTVNVIRLDPSDVFRLGMLGGMTADKFQTESQQIIHEFEKRKFDDTCDDEMFVRPLIFGERFDTVHGVDPDAVLVRCDRESGRMLRAPLMIPDGLDVLADSVCLDL